MDKESERKVSVPSRKLNLNDWLIFTYLITLTLFGIVLSILEFSYYANSIWTAAKDQIHPFWIYTELIITTLCRILVLFLFYMDIKKQDNSRFKIFRAFLLPTLILGSVSASNIGVNIYDYVICVTRHYFFDLTFARYYLYWIWTLHLLSILNSIFILILLLQPQTKEQKEQTKRNKLKQKPRIIRVIRLFWIISLLVFLWLQWLISFVLSIGNFKKFVPSMFVEVLTFFVSMGLCIFKKFIFKN